MEADTANATIAEIYGLCTGKTGEPGNWHGAQPVRALVERLAEAERLLAEAMVEMGHASIFIRSREKMHLAGIQQYDETLAALRASRGGGVR